MFCEFQSTLPRRERLNKLKTFCRLSNFNPRSREGSDGTVREVHNHERYFNPRSREGSDPSCFFCLVDLTRFQSTLPRRERQPQVPFCTGYDTDFNPRSREGSDSTIETKNTVILDFNPRSREGSDWLLSHLGWSFPISIHAPAKGATEPIMHRRPHDLHFNPRSREGSDPGKRPAVKNGSDFNPRSREGSDA